MVSISSFGGFNNIPIEPIQNLSHPAQDGSLSAISYAKEDLDSNLRSTLREGATLGTLWSMATPVGTGPIVQDVAPKGGYPKVRKE